jgi:hypothetical protein
MTARRVAAAAAFVGALVVGASLAPFDTSARTGAFAGRGAPPAFTAPRPMAAPHPAAAPHSLVGGQPLIARTHAPLARAIHAHRFGHRFAPFTTFFGPGFGWPITTWVDPGYSSFYAPSNYQMLHDQPAEPAAPAVVPYAPPPPVVTERIVPIVIYRPSCGSQTQSVPWRDGSERAITIVRC